MTEHDYSGFSDVEQVGGNRLAILTGLANEVQSAEARVEELKEELAKAEHVLNVLKRQTVPAMFDSLNGTLSLPDGRSITVKEVIKASLKDELKVPGCAWLVRNGFGSIVKSRFVIEYGRNQEELAKKFAEDLKKNSVNYKTETSVHHATLTAFVKEKLKDGVDLPFDTLGIFKFRDTIIK